MKTYRTNTQRGFTLIELLVVITIIAILAGLAFPAFAKISEKGKITQAINNCKQIIISLRLYSGDNNGLYPDSDRTDSPDTANKAFRILFKQGILETEKIFGCGASPYIPDGNIGEAPGYEKAVDSGENHWMMTKGLNDSASGGIPLVFENSTNSSGDPTWNADAAGKLMKGRTWSGGKVVIGMNDSSVEVMPCVSSKGTVSLKGSGEGKNPFTMQQDKDGEGGLEFLEVEEGGKDK
ncbi:MAG: hypothetical protein RL693_1929 [Verrucomicrobiota bacterium]|jgi:prepilin-type N-terminal cleavage/methylation domain-containing protein